MQRKRRHSLARSVHAAIYVEIHFIYIASHRYSSNTHIYIYIYIQREEEAGKKRMEEAETTETWRRKEQEKTKEDQLRPETRRREEEQIRRSRSEEDEQELMSRVEAWRQTRMATAAAAAAGEAPAARVPNLLAVCI